MRLAVFWGGYIQKLLWTAAVLKFQEDFATNLAAKMESARSEHPLYTFISIRVLIFKQAPYLRDPAWSLRCELFFPELSQEREKCSVNEKTINTGHPLFFVFKSAKHYRSPSAPTLPPRPPSSPLGQTGLLGLAHRKRAGRLTHNCGLLGVVVSAECLISQDHRGRGECYIPREGSSRVVPGGKGSLKGKSE